MYYVQVAAKTACGQGATGNVSSVFLSKNQVDPDFLWKITKNGKYMDLIYIVYVHWGFYYQKITKVCKHFLAKPL